MLVTHVLEKVNRVDDALAVMTDLILLAMIFELFDAPPNRRHLDRLENLLHLHVRDRAISSVLDEIVDSGLDA